MHTNTHTPAPAPTNPGMLAMRRTLAGMAACRAFGLEPRDAGAPKPAQAERRVSASKRETPAPESAHDEPEQERAFRVLVLVRKGEAQTHLSVDVQAAGPRRAGRAAKVRALAAGHTPVGVAATLTDACPQALWRAAQTAGHLA